MPILRCAWSGLQTPLISLLQAQIEQWIDFSTISIDAPIQSWVYPLLTPAISPYDKKVCGYQSPWVGPTICQCIHTLTMTFWLNFDMVLQKEDGAIAAIKSALSLMDKHLTKQTYLVGHHVTLADIISFSNLIIGFKQANISHEAL